MFDSKIYSCGLLLLPCSSHLHIFGFSIENTLKKNIHTPPKA
jgi:hypothetical protein